jgi:hypothetical protein
MDLLVAYGRQVTSGQAEFGSALVTRRRFPTTSEDLVGLGDDLTTPQIARKDLVVLNVTPLPVHRRIDGKYWYFVTYVGNTHLGLTYGSTELNMDFPLDSNDVLDQAEEFLRVDHHSLRLSLLGIWQAK